MVIRQNLWGQSTFEETMDFMRRHEPPEGYFLGFSGGKDSIVLKKVAQMAGVKFAAYYSATGIDPPEVCRFIRQHHPDVVWLHPKESFFALIRKIGSPNRHRRWCCDYLKKNCSKHIPLRHRLMGIRAEESAARAHRPRIDITHRPVKHWLYKPLFNWREWEIWDFIEEQKLPYPSLYDEGWSRIGCVVCPFICSSDMRAINAHKNRWPKQYKAFEIAMTRLFHDRIQKQYGHECGISPEEFIERWYRGLAFRRRGVQ